MVRWYAFLCVTPYPVGVYFPAAFAERLSHRTLNISAQGWSPLWTLA